MDEPTLQRTLRQKYNINDRLLAEGRFVGLLGDHAASLVCLGLGIRCLVVAKVVLSGEIIDYDLISISPLPLLTLSFQNKTKKIKISSQFKPTQIFQMCSSAHQAAIWDNFTSTIKDVYLPEQGDTWCSTTLLSPNKMQSTSSTSLPDFHQNSTSSASNIQNSKQRIDCISNTQSPEGSARLSTTSQSDFEQRSPSQSSCFSKNSSTLSYRSISSLPKFDSRLSESSVSLPSRLPSQIDENNNWMHTTKNNSVDLLDVKFDSFVNEVPARLNGNTYSYLIDKWNGSTEFTIKESGNKLNVSNNYIEDKDKSDTNLASEGNASEKSMSRVRRFFKKAWCCCTGQKTTDN